MTYEDYTERSVLLNNEFGITEVKNLKDVKSMSFVREQYSQITKLIVENNLDGIKNLRPHVDNGYEFITIMTFSDQKGNHYFVTGYDCNELWQDPQVIDIFRIY